MVVRLLQYFRLSSILYGETLLTILTFALLGYSPAVRLQFRRKVAVVMNAVPVENSLGVCLFVYQFSQRGASMRLLVALFPPPLPFYPKRPASPPLSHVLGF